MADVNKKYIQTCVDYACMVIDAECEEMMDHIKEAIGEDDLPELNEQEINKVEDILSELRGEILKVLGRYGHF